MTQKTEQLYAVCTPGGRQFQLRKLPKHFFLYYGELPTALMEETAQSLEQSSEADVVEQMQKLSPRELKQTLIFLREAVNYVCIKPKISLSPTGADEISPLELSEEDFNYLAFWAMKSAGGSAQGLSSFRTESAEASDNRTDGAELRKTSKRTVKNRR